MSLLSIVVPLYNEEESVTPLVEAVRRAMGPDNQWELVLVDDGSSDRTVLAASTLAAADERVRLVRLARNYGQTAAMQAGFDYARGEIVVTMDGDLQNDPDDIPLIVSTLDAGYDLVAGYRVRRQDRLVTRRLVSWVANRIIRAVTGVPIRDTGCSLKGYRREVLARLHLYSDMHRFIPAVAAATSGARITEVPVRHHARRFGTSKYGLTRIAKVAADLLTLTMIRSFRERPLVLFATGAAIALLLSLGCTLLAILANAASSVVLPGAALLWLGLALYLLMLGLVGEVAVRGEWESVRRLPIVRAVGREPVQGAR